MRKRVIVSSDSAWPFRMRLGDRLDDGPCPRLRFGVSGRVAAVSG